MYACMYVCTYVCMYVCMYVWLFVCLLMKGSISFDPNNAKFTQKIHECMGHVINYIWLKTVHNRVKNQSLKMASVTMKLRTKCFSWKLARFVLRVCICWEFQGHLLNFLSLWGCLFIYLLPNVVCMYVCVCLFVCHRKGSYSNNAKFTQKIDDCTGQEINTERREERNNHVGTCLHLNICLGNRQTRCDRRSGDNGNFMLASVKLKQQPPLHPYGQPLPNRHPSQAPPARGLKSPSVGTDDTQKKSEAHRGGWGGGGGVVPGFRQVSFEASSPPLIPDSIRRHLRRPHHPSSRPGRRQRTRPSLGDGPGNEPSEARGGPVRPCPAQRDGEADLYKQLSIPRRTVFLWSIKNLIINGIRWGSPSEGT